jgi:hypothetical protein
MITPTVNGQSGCDLGFSQGVEPTLGMLCIHNHSYRPADSFIGFFLIPGGCSMRLISQIRRIDRTASNGQNEGLSNSSKCRARYLGANDFEVEWQQKPEDH